MLLSCLGVADTAAWLGEVMSIDALTSVATVALERGPVRGMKIAENGQVASPAEKLTPGRSAPLDFRAAVQAAARQIDSYLRSVGREVEFRVDEDTDLTVVTVRNTATGEVIRQIPSEEALQLARHLESGSVLLSLTV